MQKIEEDERLCREMIEAICTNTYCDLFEQRCKEEGDVDEQTIFDRATAWRWTLWRSGEPVTYQRNFWSRHRVDVRELVEKKRETITFLMPHLDPGVDPERCHEAQRFDMLVYQALLQQQEELFTEEEIDRDFLETFGWRCGLDDIQCQKDKELRDIRTRMERRRMRRGVKRYRIMTVMFN